MSYQGWLLIFRISGLLLVTSLMGVLLPLGKDASLICWIVGGVSAPICLLAAIKMKDAERMDAVVDFSEGVPDVVDD